MEVSCCSPCCFFPSPTHTDIFECCDLFDQVLLKRKKSRGELNSQLLASFNHLHIKCTASRWIYEYVNRHRRKNTGGCNSTSILAPHYRIIPPPAFFPSAMSFGILFIGEPRGKYDFTVDNRRRRRRNAPFILVVERALKTVYLMHCPLLFVCVIWQEWIIAFN